MIDTKKMKAQLIHLTGCAGLKVRKGTGSHRNGVLVYLPKAVRTSRESMAQVLTFIEKEHGLIDIMKAFTTPGPMRPYVSIQPLYEEPTP